MSISNNTSLLNNLLIQANALPDASSLTPAENLEIELAEQADLIAEQDIKIAELSNILAEKAGKNDNQLSTCTVEISCINGNFGSTDGTLCYTTIENNQIVAKRIDGMINNISIECLCGSLLIIHESTDRVNHEYFGLELLATTNTFFINYIYPFMVTASAGETATLSIELD